MIVGDCMENTYKNKVEIFKALSDENRLCILDTLKNKSMCANDLLESLSISQPTLSHHMAILIEAELVCGKKEGKKMMYAIAKNALNDIMSFTEELIGGSVKISDKNSLIMGSGAKLKDKYKKQVKKKRSPAKEGKKEEPKEEKRRTEEIWLL